METRMVRLTMREEQWSAIDRLAGQDLESTITSLIIRGLGVNQWSNPAALGYAILAAKHLGYNREQIKALVSAMYWVFDEKTVQEAEEAYARHNS